MFELASTLVADSSIGGTISQFANYGVLGVFMIGILIGWIVPGYIDKAKDKEIERLRSELVDFRKSVEEKFIPAMNESSTTTKEVLRFLNRKGE